MRTSTRPPVVFSWTLPADLENLVEDAISDIRGSHTLCKVRRDFLKTPRAQPSACIQCASLCLHCLHTPNMAVQHVYLGAVASLHLHGSASRLAPCGGPWGQGHVTLPEQATEHPQELRHLTCQDQPWALVSLVGGSIAVSTRVKGPGECLEKSTHMTSILLWILQCLRDFGGPWPSSLVVDVREHSAGPRGRRGGGEAAAGLWVSGSRTTEGDGRRQVHICEQGSGNEVPPLHGHVQLSINFEHQF